MPRDIQGHEVEAPGAEVGAESGEGVGVVEPAMECEDSPRAGNGLVAPPLEGNRGAGVEVEGARPPADHRHGGMGEGEREWWS